MRLNKLVRMVDGKILEGVFGMILSLQPLAESAQFANRVMLEHK